MNYIKNIIIIIKISKINIKDIYSLFNRVNNERDLFIKCKRYEFRLFYELLINLFSPFTNNFILNYKILKLK